MNSRALAIAVLLGLAACASGPEVRSIADPAADFSRYRTFAFASPLGTDRGGYKSVVSEALKAATRREMAARGYAEAGAGADLIVNFNARLDDRQRVDSVPVPVTPGLGYYGYRRGLYAPLPMYAEQTMVTNYREGTLNIDVADAARKQLVWEGVVIGQVSGKAMNNVEAAVSNAVAAAFARFPRPASR